MSKTIATAEIKHLDVRAVAEREGCETVSVSAFPHPAHPGSADWTLCVYDLPSGCRAAVTNGNAAWDQNPDYFETLAEYGLGADLEPEDQPAPRYQLQTRDAWAGRPGGTWLPAVAGTANQTGLSDDEASTFAGEAEAEEAAVALEAEGLTEWRVVEL